jgi:ketosteroid isomerase-like protein
LIEAIGFRRRAVTPAFLVASAFASVLAAVQNPPPESPAPIPPALAAMVEAEREFAAAARVKGIRDAFLEFFADDAMFEPGRGKAKDQLRQQKPQPFTERELVWEPRTGDVAASGELGWLTGPGTFINHAADRTPRYSNYMSVWRKEPDRRWRVFIDIGTTLEAPAIFAPGFTRFVFADRYTGKESKADARERLAAADRAFNDRLTSAGPAAAFVEVLAPGGRVHREGVGALTGATAVRSWLSEHASGMTARNTAAESAESADLGYTYGNYQLRPSEKSGAYLRIWSRDRQGRWRLVADVLSPLR